MKLIKKIISLLSAKEKKQGILVLLIAILMAIFEVLGVASVTPFLAVMSDPSIVESNSALSKIYKDLNFNSVNNFLIFLGIISFSIMLISAFVRTLGIYLITKFAQLRRHSISLVLLNSYLSKDYEFFLARDTAELSKTLLSEVDQVVNGVIQPFSSFVAYSSASIALLLFLILINPITTLAALGLIGLSFLLIFLLVRPKMAQLGSKQIEANKDRFKAASEALNGIKEIKLYRRESFYLNQFSKPTYLMARYISFNQLLSQIPRFLIEAFAFGGIILLAIMLLQNSGGIEANNLGNIIPLLGLYAFSGLKLLPAIQVVYQSSTQIQFWQSAINNLLKDFIKGLEAKATNEMTGDSINLGIFDALELKNLSFSYPKSNQQALEEISFSIQKNDSLAVIGRSGSGKSTLVDIILGLIKPTKGDILINNCNLRENIVRSWQSKIGYVPQEIYLLDSSIYENIAFGIPLEKIDRERVRSVSKIAQISSFIENELEFKYEHIIGERGIQLSGGQRQRIGIARALYNDPEIIIFDEATSSLDNKTEKDIIDSLGLVAKDKTLIVIAHRMSSISICNKVLILNNGSVSNFGNYNELKDSDMFMKELLKIESQ